MYRLYIFILLFLFSLSTHALTRTSVQSGNWIDPLTWDTGVPVSTDNAIISAGHTVVITNSIVINNITVNNGSILSNTKNFIINGNFILDGICDGKKDILLNGVGSTIYGYGSKTNMGQVTISGNKTIGPSTDLNISNDIQINTNTTIINSGKVTIQNRLIGIDTTSTWVNSTNSQLNIGNNLLDIGTLVASSSGNTVNYSRAGPQTVKVTSDSNYYNLKISGNNTKTLTSNINIINDLSLSATLNVNGNTLILLSDASGTARISEISGGSLTGNFIIQRYIAGDDDWRLLASPVNGSTLADWNTEIVMSGFPGSNAPSFPFISVATYDETAGGIYDNGYVYPSNITDGVNNGVGYFIWVGDVLGLPITKTIDMTGTLTSGQNMDVVNLTVSHTVSSGDIDDGWNLIGNPYPSDIYWDSVTLSGTLTPFGYIWDPNSDAYISFDQSSGRTVPSHQGMWVKVAEGGMGTHTETVTFNESDKSGDGNNYLKTSVDSMNHIHLNLVGNGFDRSTEIRFIQNATQDYDWMYDAFSIPSLNSNSPNFSSVSNNAVDLSINSISELTENFDIPIRISWNSAGPTNNYIISADSIEIPETSCLILEDQWINVFTDIRDTSYSFSMVQNTNQPARFILHVSAPINISSTDVTCNGSDDGVASVPSGNYIWINSVNDTISFDSMITNLAPDVYTVYNLMCYTSESVTISEPISLNLTSIISDIDCYNDNTGNIDLNVSGGISPYNYLWNNGDTIEDLSQLISGQYDITIADQNNCAFTDSFIVNESSEIESTYYVSDETCIDQNNGSINVIVNGGISPYSYLWSTGDMTDTVSNISSGDYFVTVTDNLGCIHTVSNITVNPGINLLVGYTLNTSTIYVGDSAQFTNISINGNSFLWDFGDGNISTQENPLYAYTNPGNYSVMLTISNSGCSKSSSNTINVIEDVSIEEIKIIEVDGTIINNLDIKIELYNLLGQKIDMPITKNGIYIIRLEIEGNYYTKKILIAN